MTEPLLFDMDGVLLEGTGTDPSIYAAAADDAIEALGLEPTPAQRRDLRRHEIEPVLEHAADLGVDPDTFWATKDEHASRRSREVISAGERGLYDDVDVVHDLAAATTLGLVSNNRHETATFVATHFELPFAAVRGRAPTIDGSRRRKPDPHYLERTLETLDAEGGIYFGDRATDVRAARAAGLEAAYLRRPHNAEEPLPAGTSYELSSLEALPSLLD